GTDKAVSQSRKHRKPGVSNGKVKKHKKVKEIKWTEGKDSKKPPITEKNTSNPNTSTSGDSGDVVSVGSSELIKEAVYDVSYFIPFGVNNYLGSANASDRFVQYLAGMKVATRILEKEGVNLNINVIDEKDRKFEDVLRENVNGNTDVIVGPYDRKNLKKAAKYAKDKRIPLVSPWQSSPKIAKNNPYYIQLRPSLNEHYYAMFNDIKENFDRSQVIIIGRNTVTDDVKRLKRLQRMAADVWKVKEREPIEYYSVIQDSLDYGVTAFDSIFFEEKPTVILIPNWSFKKDEGFIYACLRRLSVEKGMNKVVVYGMPIMMESEKINFDFYSALNMKVARSKFVDQQDYDVRRFKKDFVDTYGALPTDSAFEGYDNLMYIGRNITEYGKNFQYHLNNDRGFYLQAGYNVTATNKSSSDDKPIIKYFENKNVDIVEFKNARFSRKPKS
ncbi:MAG: hypothetical protein V3V14_13015, partial [Saprospiraceae bacterium]